MKKLLVLVFAIIGITNVSQAQLEVTTNPVGLLFGAYALSLDYNINPDFSFGAEGAFVNETSEAYFIYINAKHYFFPTERGSNGIYVGIFGGQNRYENINYYDLTTQTIKQNGIGFMGGYKITSRKNIILDLAAGVGKSFGESDSSINILPYFKANVGYRFNVKSKEIPPFKN